MRLLAGTTFTGLEWCAEELRLALRASGFDEDEVLVGLRKSFGPVLEGCDVLVVPSRLDKPFGNKAVEGELVLRPLIVSDATGLSEADSGYPKDQLIAGGDSKALTASLRRLVGDWDTVSGLVGLGADLAHNNHAHYTYRRRIRETVVQRVVSRQTARC